MPVTINREMSITRDDFFRILPKALKEINYEIIGNRILCHINDGLIEIELTVGKNKKIGALELPIVQVTFSLDNISDDIQTRFFSKFDFAFQKGGG